MQRRRQIGMLVVVLLIATAALVWGPRWRARMQADHTARRTVSALRSVDSSQLADLSAVGSAQNLLCVRRHWPPAFWSRDGHEPQPRRAGQNAGNWRYRVVGDRLPGDTNRAVFDLFINPDQPRKVTSFFADARTGVWTPELRSCLRP